MNTKTGKQNNVAFFEALDELEAKKGIPKEYMLEKIEAALLNAYKRDHGGRTNAHVVVNEEQKDIKMYAQKDVVEVVEDPETQISLEDAKTFSKKHKIGDVCEIEIETKNFGRLSATTGKNVIMQGIREAESKAMDHIYGEKKGEAITATVTKIDPTNGNVIVDTGTSEEILTKDEQIPGETFEVGDHIKVLIMEVKSEAARGPKVSLSRTHFNLVKRLFELEVPEIISGDVIINGISREAGSRTKIAVASRDENVDAVGACIGNRGTRIAEIVNELRGEKIDIIQYSEDPAAYIKAALSPANVKDVILTEGEKSCRVIVAPDQLSLAIGREGQNARLAARLTGYKIDIKTE